MEIGGRLREAIMCCVAEKKYKVIVRTRVVFERGSLCTPCNILCTQRLID